MAHDTHADEKPKADGHHIPKADACCDDDCCSTAKADACEPPPLKMPLGETLVLPKLEPCTDDCCATDGHRPDAMDDCCDAKQDTLEILARDTGQRRVLTIVLALNAAMFAVEFGAGLIAGSAALMADSVDMLGDALVYGLSLYALDRSAHWKAGAALAKGGFILLLGIGILIEISVKMTMGVPPSSPIMLAIGGLALAVNLFCLSLLWQFRNLDINMSSTFECSRNDVLANVGVLIAAAGVAYFASPWPDLAVGAIIAALFLRSAVSVLTRAWPQFRRGQL